MTMIKIVKYITLLAIILLAAVSFTSVPFNSYYMFSQMLPPDKIVKSVFDFDIKWL